MTIFDKFQYLVDTRKTLQTVGIDSIHVVMDTVNSPTEAMVNGRKMILAGTNNYLGLTFDPTCIDAACEAARAEGTGTTGSRAANGSYAAHLKLERELADFFEFYGVVHDDP